MFCSSAGSSHLRLYFASVADTFAKNKLKLENKTPECVFIFLSNDKNVMNIFFEKKERNAAFIMIYIVKPAWVHWHNLHPYV